MSGDIDQPKQQDPDQIRYRDLPRAARRRVTRLLSKGAPLHIALKMECDTCPKCRAGYCPCGQSDLPYIKRDHYQCMHRVSECSVKISQKMRADQAESLDRIGKAAEQESSLV